MKTQSKLITLLGLAIAALGEFLHNNQEVILTVVPPKYGWILQIVGIALVAAGPSLTHGKNSLDRKTDPSLQEIAAKVDDVEGGNFGK